MADFDAKELDRAFTRAKQDTKAVSPSKEVEASIKALMDGEAGIAGVSGFCEAWAKVRPFLNMAVNLVAMLFPNQAQLAKTVIRVIDRQLIPAVCGTPE